MSDPDRRYLQPGWLAETLEVIATAAEAACGYPPRPQTAELTARYVVSMLTHAAQQTPHTEGHRWQAALAAADAATWLGDDTPTSRELWYTARQHVTSPSAER